jgi:hypothetical protein
MGWKKFPLIILVSENYLTVLQQWCCIILVYVNDLNIIGIELDISEARQHLKTEFKMKDLGKTNFCLGLQLGQQHEELFDPVLFDPHWKV